MNDTNCVDGKWAVMVNKPDMCGIYAYFEKRGDAERCAQRIDGWVLANGNGAQAVAERLVLYPEKDLGSRRDS